MSNAVLSHLTRPESSVAPGTKQVVAGVLAIWLALVFLLGAAGSFVSPPGTPPIAIFIGVVAPILIFLAAFRISHGFRTFVLALDLRMVTAMQAWRFAGFGFLALYANGILPGMFAWPAGLGDIAIGLTAPWLVMTLIRNPEFGASQSFVVWNLLGILDFVIAVSTGTFSTILATGTPGEITTGPMAQLPLVLIPAYLVPFFFMLHLAAIFQARRIGA